MKTRRVSVADRETEDERKDVQFLGEEQPSEPVEKGSPDGRHWSSMTTPEKKERKLGRKDDCWL
jgi:hypothetical protein